MRKWIWLVFLFLSFWQTNVFASGNAVLLDINGAISPSVGDYIVRGIEKAVEMKAKLIIIQLNTPGGLETSMREINAAIIASPIPIVTYVSPSGARAASAGVFIMYASNFSAMAPGTNIGAASPVNLASDSSEKDVHIKKATNDAAAYLRSLAELRGRNVQWAELAVTNAASLSAAEAKKLNVINNIASDINQLLTAINGKSTIINNASIKLDTTQLTIQPIQPDWRSRFLAFITDPNIAYLLMLVALYGLFFEFSNPGLVLPGVAGIIALLLALYAFQLLPVNYTGLTLIFIGIAFMAYEVSASTFGVVGAGGIIAFVIGSIMLYDTNNPHFQIAYSLIAAMTIVTASFLMLAVTLMIRSHKKPVVTGHGMLLGKEGIVMRIEGDHAVIQIMGEIWNAHSHLTLMPGQQVKVMRAEGLLLTVEPIRKGN
jgi:membrane-bound serine protease (ClpP class)